MWERTVSIGKNSEKKHTIYTILIGYLPLLQLVITLFPLFVTVIHDLPFPYKKASSIDCDVELIWNKCQIESINLFNINFNLFNINLHLQMATTKQHILIFNICWTLQQHKKYSFCHVQIIWGWIHNSPVTICFQLPLAWQSCEMQLKGL